MDVEIEKAIERFLNKYNRALEINNFKEAKNIVNELRAFLEGLTVAESRPAMQLFGKYAILFSYILDWLVVLSKKVAELKEEMEREKNNVSLNPYMIKTLVTSSTV